MANVINVELFDDIDFGELDVDLGDKQSVIQFCIYLIAYKTNNESEEIREDISEDHMKIIGICDRKDTINLCNNLVAYFLSNTEEYEDCKYMIFDPFLMGSGYITLYNQNKDTVESYSVIDPDIIDGEDPIELVYSMPLSLIQIALMDERNILKDDEHSESGTAICH